jgi:hypothetical protein
LHKRVKEKKKTNIRGSMDPELTSCPLSHELIQFPDCHIELSPYSKLTLSLLQLLYSMAA